LSSGATITFSHHSLIHGNRKQALLGCYVTIFLAISFTVFQGLEYNVSSFTISDGIFGSCFFFGTGFHGLHVLIGTIFIATELSRLLVYQFTSNHHCGFESSILY
jgi:cytochrome c oxidase subunit 3